MLDIISSLLALNTCPKKKNDRKWAAIDEAVSNGDEALIELLFDGMVANKIRKINYSFRKASDFFNEHKEDFTIKMKWDIEVPLLTMFTPKDEVILYKQGRNARADFTFADFKNMKVVRANMSSIFLGDKLKYFRINWDDKHFIENFTALKESERKILIKDLAEGKKFSADFQLKDYKVYPAKTMFGKEVREKVNGLETRVYNVDLKMSFLASKKAKAEYKETLDGDNYFRDAGASFRVFEGVNNVKESTVDKEEDLELNDEKKDKKLSCKLWIAEGFPMDSSAFINIIDSLSHSNKLISKIQEFMKSDEVMEIVKNKGFPVKIKIPYNFAIGLKVTFFDYEWIFKKATERG